MALKNVSIVVTYYAWDTANNVGKTGDSANHTLKVIKDGTEASVTNSPSEVDSTNCPGLYKLTLTAGEMNTAATTLHGKSSTSGVVISPVQIITEGGYVDAAISSRSTYAGTDTSGTTTLLTRVPAILPTEVAAKAFKKNTAFSNYLFVMFNGNTPTTGLTVTAQRSIDGAAFGNCANSVSEVGAGVYKLNLAAGDVNGDIICLKFTATGADNMYVIIRTES